MEGEGSATLAESPMLFGDDPVGDPVGRASADDVSVVGVQTVYDNSFSAFQSADDELMQAFQDAKETIAQLFDQLEVAMRAQLVGAESMQHAELERLRSEALAKAKGIAALKTSIQKLVGRTKTLRE